MQLRYCRVTARKLFFYLKPHIFCPALMFYHPSFCSLPLPKKWLSPTKLTQKCKLSLSSLSVICVRMNLDRVQVELGSHLMFSVALATSSDDHDTYINNDNTFHIAAYTSLIKPQTSADFSNLFIHTKMACLACF